MEDIITIRRRKLAEIRQKINSQSPLEPFSISKTLTTGEIISDFVVSLALNIHKKRVVKTC